MKIDFQSKEFQVIIGSILGDMSLIKKSKNSRPHLEESHSMKQMDYLLWKFNKIRNFNVKVEIVTKYDKRYNRRYKQVKMTSKVSENLEAFHKLFYKNQKKILNKKYLDI